MEETVLLTGSSGFIGSNLLLKWLSETRAHLVLLVRGRHGEAPRSRIEAVLAELSGAEQTARFLDRIEVVEGDLALDRLGLSGSVYGDLAGRVSHIIHCAAAARFDLDLDEARKINVGGTRRVIDFAGACAKLARIDYVGTAYVAGKRKGIIREDELDEGQEHNNTYERSKLEAEVFVRERMKDLPIAIYRPSIVICDSKTGRASSYNGFYRALRLYWHGVLTILPGYPSSILDLVPVDYVTDALFAISNNPGSLGRCHHLTAGLDNGTTLERVRKLAARHFNRKEFTILSPENFGGHISKMESGLPDEMRGAIDEIRLYSPYLLSDLRFDDSNTRGIVSSPAPGVESYFGKMAGYIMRH